MCSYIIFRIIYKTRHLFRLKSSLLSLKSTTKQIYNTLFTCILFGILHTSPYGSIPKVDPPRRTDKKLDGILFKSNNTVILTSGSGIVGASFHPHLRCVARGLLESFNKFFEHLQTTLYYIYLIFGKLRSL